MQPLYPYQDAIVRDVLDRDAAYLGVEMGLGKSRMALEVAKGQFADRIAVFCNAVGRLTWRHEVQRWWPEMPVYVIRNYKDAVALKNDRGVFIIAYSSISGAANSGFDVVTLLKKYRFDMTILDEAHALKNPGAIRTKALLKILKPCLGYILPMSGTPAPNHAGELHSILYALFPETILNGNKQPMKAHEFEDHYCVKANRRFGGRVVQVIEGSKNLDELKRRIAPIMIRKRKAEVLTDLPPMTFDTYPVDAPDAPPWRAGGDWKNMDDADFEAMLDSVDSHVMRMRHELGVSKVDGAVEVICDILDNAPGRKVLVFAHHASVIDGLMLKLQLYAPVKIDGRTGQATRDKAIHTFLEDDRCRAFVGNIAAAGTTITLVGPKNNVSDVVFVEASFSPAENLQAASRIHRIGQPNPVQVWFLTADGTYDDRIMDIITTKTRDFHALFDEASP